MTGGNLATNCVNTNEILSGHFAAAIFVLEIARIGVQCCQCQFGKKLDSTFKKGLFMAQAITKSIFAAASLSAAAAAFLQMSVLSSAVAQDVPRQKWFKACAKEADNDVCNVQYQVVASNGQIITSVNLFTVKGKLNRRLFQVTVPTNRLLPAGVAIKVDKKKENRIPYTTCVRDRCIADVKMDDNLVKLLKSGVELVVMSTNIQNKPNPIKISLKGFTAAYDGPALKKFDVDAQNQELQKQLKAKAEKVRKALQDAQQKATQ